MKRLRIAGVSIGVSMWLLVVVSLSPVTAHAQPSLAQRIQRLDDIEEIRTLMTNYGRFLDAHDFKSYGQLFAKDGEWVGGPLRPGRRG